MHGFQSTQLTLSVTPTFATQLSPWNASAVLKSGGVNQLYISDQQSLVILGTPWQPKKQRRKPFVEDCILSSILHSLR